ncbi:MAG: type II toxin-antitoxin system RelB/DinJ family antitoxin [Bacilli bacterium]|nr:type II toxin-antitoxin system RelB/DinJ family antitoxin [Bacilli bacterium]
MEREIVTVRVDRETKIEAEELFEDFGLTMSGAINIFLKQCIKDGKIPFEITKSKTPGRKEKPLFSTTKRK